MNADDFLIERFYDEPDEFVHEPCHIRLLAIRDDTSLSALLKAAEEHDCEAAQQQERERRAAEREQQKRLEIKRAKQVLAMHGESFEYEPPKPLPTIRKVTP